MNAKTLKTWLSVHSGVGIAAGLLLFIAFYAGALTLFHHEIEEWSTAAEPPAGPPPTLDDAQRLLDGVLAQAPKMAADIRRVLRPDGIYVQNVIDYPPDRFIRAELATVAAEFRNVALIAPPGAIDGQAGANFLIVASDAPLPLAGIPAQLRLLPEPARLLHGDKLAAFVGDALVLTDDFAPVDQLLATA